MKRTFLTFALSGALGMALLGSASRAMATCAPGTVGSAILGNYAIKIVGAEVDTGTSGDPKPNPIVGVGVIAVDGTCDVTGGELIYNDGGTITGPANDAPPRNAVVAFSGSLSANISAGTYSLNTNNTGFLTLTDTTGGMNGGNPVTFGITVELGGAEFRGVRTNGGTAAGSPPPNDAPLTILGERQGSATPGTPALTTTTFENPFAISCDTVGTTTTGLGLGYQPLSGTVQEHPFPPLDTTSISINSNLWFDNNGGTINGSTIVPPNGGAFLCDIGGDILGVPSLVDGTQNTDGLFEINFDCPIRANTDSSWVLWGSSYQNAFTILTGAQVPGSGFEPVTSVSSCTAGKTIVGGTDHLAPSPVTLHSTGAPVTITITNDAASPMDYASISLSSALSGFVTITGGTCTTNVAGSIPSDNLAYGPGICTVILADTGTPCAATGPDHIAGSATPGPGLGTLTVALNDHLIAGTTEDASGAEVAVTCTH
jgi:hypothetical protein